jgi:hypothetical protein
MGIPFVCCPIGFEGLRNPWVMSNTLTVAAISVDSFPKEREMIALKISMKDLKTRVIGWREWIALPDLGIAAIKAKIDTGARSSALHAFDVETFSLDGQEKIRFKVHPQQRDITQTTISEADILDRREVRNSGGYVELRYAILTSIEIGGVRWSIELTLTNRDTMGFRMLLGRQAIRDRFFVDPGRSFLLDSHSQPTPFADRVELKE